MMYTYIRSFINYIVVQLDITSMCARAGVPRWRGPLADAASATFLEIEILLYWPEEDGERTPFEIIHQC